MDTWVVKTCLFTDKSMLWTAPSTKTLNIYSSSDLTTWDLLQTEAVESAENTLFLKATLSN